MWASLAPPMSVTIRDVNTNEEIIIPPQGLTFGRTGGDADVQLDDGTISRRHARVSLKGGNWLVETIAVAQGQRPPRPVTLVEGQTFIVGQNEFEVVSIAEAEEAPEEPVLTKPSARPAQPAAKPLSRSPTQKTTPAVAPTKRAAPPPKNTAASEAEPDGAEAGQSEAPVKGFASMFVAVPKGLAYYLVNVPKLLFNPLGTVKTTIEELPAEPMGKIELIGYALPALLASGLLGSIAGGLALLIGPGHVFSPMSFIPIVPAIIAVIGAIITGFIFHPLMEWIIRFLKGESDARSRTNYFLQLMTLSIVLAVPNALGVILGALPIPFINLVGPLLMTVASLVSIYVAYQWFVSFGVVKWFRTILLVLGALSVLGAAYGLVMGVVNTIQGFRSTSTTASTEPVAGEVVEQEGPQGSARAEKSGASAQHIEPTKKAQKLAAAVEPAEKEKADRPEKAEKVAKNDAPPPEPAEVEAEAEAVVAEEAPMVVKTTPEPRSALPGRAGGGYAEFARKRDAIERTLAADPTVLASADLQELYGEFLKTSAEVEKKWQRDIAKNANRARLFEHLRDAELYSKTAKEVDQLASKLKIH